MFYDPSLLDLQKDSDEKYNEEDIEAMLDPEKSNGLREVYSDNLHDTVW